MATSIEGAMTSKIAEGLADYLNDDGWEIELVKGKEVLGSRSLSQIIDGQIELAFVMNDQAHQQDADVIRTVIPLFPNISYIFYRDHLNPAGLRDLLQNQQIGISKDDEVFYRSLFEYYGMDADSIDYSLVEIEGSVQKFIDEVTEGKNGVICAFAAIHTPYVKEMLDNGWEILSLGDITFSNRGSSVEGFCMNYPRTEPFIVPRNFFGQKPELPIFTISLNEILVTHKDVDKTVIYDLISSIYGGKHFLSQKDNLFNYLSEDIDRDALNFPLHQATIDYLRRDAPSFFERYAEAFGVVFSILVVLVGGLTSLKKIRKERIDKYYKRVVNCQSIEDLEQISNEAVQQLQNERLTADESFTIFLNLVEKRRQEIINTPLNNK